MKEINVRCKKLRLDYRDIINNGGGAYVLLNKRTKEDDSLFFGLNDPNSICRDSFLATVHTEFAKGAKFVEFLFMTGTEYNLLNITKGTNLLSSSKMFIPGAGDVEWVAVSAEGHPAILFRYPSGQYIDPIYFWEITHNFRLKTIGLTQVDIGTPGTFYHPDIYFPWVMQARSTFLSAAAKFEELSYNGGNVIGFNSPAHLHYFLTNTPANILKGISKGLDIKNKLPLKGSAGNYLGAIRDKIENYNRFHPLLGNFLEEGWSINMLKETTEKLI